MTARLITIPGQPVAKPRQTRRDRWKQRACVLRYRQWADQARALAHRVWPIDPPTRVEIIAFFRHPKSRSRKRAGLMAGTRHQVKPDVDNVIKAVLDALFPRDQVVADVVAQKRWDDGEGPRTVVRVDW